MEVKITQHPVGQGGMASGFLQSQNSQFHWIYDCGSNQSEALNREIEIVAARGKVDCLFLSHLDSDHINGIDRLLSRTRVREVVLPYLNEIDGLIAVAHDTATGILAGTFMTFLSNIEGWLSARGVEQITYIMPRSDDDDENEELNPNLPEGGTNSDEGIISAEWSLTDTKSSSSPVMKVQKLETKAILKIMTAPMKPNWIFAPYAHRPSDKALIAFKADLKATFGHFNTKRILATVLRDPQARIQLRNCYELIWSNHNLVSMALYAGPIRSSAQWQGYRRQSPYWQYRRYPYSEPCVVGWIGTGDMQLNLSRRYKAFITYYRKLLNEINIFVLPHHGSYHNFTPLLLKEIPYATQCVAAAGPNSYGHPGEEVIRAVLASGKEFVHISDQIHSALEWELLS
ncbi:MBL fold metallo-hydrolase [Methyloradius palustris]|uniref:Metallo-beta-lactamase domain-containing protein n=1 Tax=Methyloradius palustris TaxID=2778876 RepID=A0A8D5K016_9PROT|nr:MBL fold metallo-hydrolase [Methyloradius palustris]BCM26202.1 hypothetical protein ZMTM_24610 [Methyloradius palustris]